MVVYSNLSLSFLEMPKKFHRTSMKKSKDKKQDREISKLKRLVKPEVKHFFQETVFAASTAGVLLRLNPIAQGDASNQREAISVRSLGFDYRYTVLNASSAQASARVILFYFDASSAGTVPVTGQVLRNDVAAVTPLSSQNNLYKNAVHIVYDRLHTFGRDYAAAVTTASDNVNDIVRFRYRKPRQVTWTDDTGTNHLKGALFLLIIASSASVSILQSIDYKYIDS